MVGVELSFSLYDGRIEVRVGEKIKFSRNVTEKGRIKW